MFEIKKSSIVPRRVVDKLPESDRPNYYQLYQFFIGNKNLITKETRKKMLKVLEEDFKAIKQYLLHD